MPRTGRTPKLTTTATAAVVQAISTGNTRDVAAAYAGVGRTTLFQWLAKGRVEAQGIYRDFLNAVEKAEADAVVVSVALIRTAAQKNWQAAAWWLERRYPDEWGRKDRLSIESLKRTEAEKMARELGIEVEEVMSAIDDILSGRD